MASLSFGQGFTASLYNLTEVLTDQCTGGNPLPDGTIVQIIQDFAPFGPSENDTLPVTGNLDGEVNFNSFPINGNTVLTTPGTFSIGAAPFMGWASNGFVPSPSTFYLVVCGEGITYYSSTFFVSQDYNELYFGGDDIPWTCADSTYSDQLPPPPPYGLSVSSDLCTGIELTWDYDWEYTGGDICGWVIYRGTSTATSPIDTVWFTQMPDPPYTYLDDEAEVGPGTYHMGVVRCFDDDTLGSGRSYFRTGNRLPGPPVPTITYVSQLDTCNIVRVTMQVLTIAGLDEVRLYREAGDEDVLIGSRTDMMAGGLFNIYDTDPIPGQQQYYAVGYSDLCGEGFPSEAENGGALLAPQGTVEITEVDETCDAVCLDWTYSGTDEVTYFVIIRNTQRHDSVDGTTFTYCDQTAVAGAQIGYRVIAKNDCGDAAEASTPVIGVRLGVPDAPTEVEATTDDCECVEITWTDPEDDNLASLGVYRNTTLIATVDPDVETYEDCDVEFNTDYSYTVSATNTCGEGDQSAGVTGSLGNPDGGTASLAIVSQGPPNWDYSLTWTSGCVSKLTIRSLCDGTTASWEGTADWQAQVYDDGDSVVFWTETEPLGEGVLTGFRLTNSTGCQGEGTWTAGTDGGTIEGPLPINGGLELPMEYSLAVYPNPFNPSTNLEFALPKAGHVNVNVYDVSGRLVREVVSEAFNAGYHSVNFNGTGLPSGLYFARVSADNFVATKKLMLLK
jgi:hypothetical protein